VNFCKISVKISVLEKFEKKLKKLAYATRNLGYVQFIMWTAHTMRLSCLSEQLVRSWEQLVLKDTKKGFYYALIKVQYRTTIDVSPQF